MATETIAIVKCNFFTYITPLAMVARIPWHVEQLRKRRTWMLHSHSMPLMIIVLINIRKGCLSNQSTRRALPPSWLPPTNVTEHTDAGLRVLLQTIV